MAYEHNPVLNKLHRLEKKMDVATEQQHDFMSRQANGENPDPNEFMELLQAQSVTHSAMTAQFNLIQKPLKTVLNESK